MLCYTCTRQVQFDNKAYDPQVQIEKKEKNKSREEIFYKMKVFFVKISCRKSFL